jgi:hypothetical protein
LFRRRERLGQLLDRAYLKQIMSDYLVIESRHRRVALMIDRLLPKLSPHERQELQRGL